jgi:hypothetical protein
MFRNRWLIALTAIALALALVPVIADAHARAGGGLSGGSRGMRTFSAPPTIPTAPTTAPIQNSMRQPGSTAPIGQTGMRPGLFGGGLFGGIAAGFLGAGLFGMLFGHGLFGGMAGFASILGLLLQVMLIVIVARLIKLGIPAAVWSTQKKCWLDGERRPLTQKGDPQLVAKCPWRIGIMSTGLIVKGDDEGERGAVAKKSFGVVILDEAHKARASRGMQGHDPPKPNNLLSFLHAITRNAQSVILGTATPIQLDAMEGRLPSGVQYRR